MDGRYRSLEVGEGAEVDASGIKRIARARDADEVAEAISAVIQGQLTNSLRTRGQPIPRTFRGRLLG